MSACACLFFVLKMCMFNCLQNLQSHLQTHGHHHILKNNLTSESWVSNKSWNRSWNIICSNERHDCDHSKTSIVQLSLSLGLKNSWVNVGEIKLWENNFWKRTSLGVVYSLGFGRKFSNKDGSDDLCLSCIWYCLPCIKWVHLGKFLEGYGGRKHSWEVESSSLYKVSCGCKHSNTRVLKLCSTEPCKSRLISELGNTKRVEVLEWSSSSSNSLKINTESSAGL